MSATGNEGASSSSGGGGSGVGGDNRGGGWRDQRTLQLRTIEADLADAYQSVRRRGQALRRRRIASSAIALVVLAGLLSVVGSYYIASIPLPDQLNLPTTTTVYYSDATTVMARLGSQNRVLVDPATLPRFVGAAVVAAQDPDFWHTSGTKISRYYLRIAAAAEASPGGAGSAAPAGTTSALGRARQQVAAWRLEDQYGKASILGFYLNSAYFGRGAYGIGAAAQAYFGASASQLSLEQAVLLAGLLAAPGDGRFDPTVAPATAIDRFATVARALAGLGEISAADADALRMPRVNPYQSTVFQSGLDRPTGLVIGQALAELRASGAFAGPTYAGASALADAGLRIVTTIDSTAQRLLEQTADETVPGSIMADQPNNLQAAAVVVQPGTGRVLAYYGGHDGSGADYAGAYNDRGVAVGYGQHPPAQTFDIFSLGAALAAGVSLNSRWRSPTEQDFGAVRVKETTSVACQPVCGLVEATTASRNVPYYRLVSQVGADRVIDLARAAGISAMWIPATAATPARRVDLRDSAQVASAAFGPEVALGLYPVTVVDQANAAATFAAGGSHSIVHFVARVSKGDQVLYEELPGTDSARILEPDQVADLTWALAQSPASRLPDARPSAVKVGTWPLRGSLVESAHAWAVGFTANLAMAVWVGNVEDELPLKNREGGRVTGGGFPVDIYRAFQTQAAQQLALPVVAFPAPKFGGDPKAGDG